MTIDKFPREKNWKLIYCRTNKLHRSKQLGFRYPKITESQMLADESTNVLFVCSMNRWRSPTAEKIYSSRSLIEAKSAGINPGARRKVNSRLLKWADLVFVMEEKHKCRLLADFPGEMSYKDLFVLEISDDYQFMQQDLIREITSKVSPVLEKLKS